MLMQMSRAKAGGWIFIVCPQSARIATSASSTVNNINWLWSAYETGDS